MPETIVADANWGLVPDHLHDELESWLCFGHMPGSRFLMAVLANDLDAAMVAATPVEDEKLVDLVHFLKLHAPGLAHGSLTKMLMWEFLGGLVGRDLAEMVAAQ